MDNAPMTPPVGTNPASNPLPGPGVAPTLGSTPPVVSPTTPSLAVPPAPVATGPATPPSIPPEPKKSSPMVMIIILVAVLALAAIGFFVWQSMQTPEVTITPSQNTVPTTTELERPAPVEELLPPEDIAPPAAQDEGLQVEPFPADEFGAEGETEVMTETELTTQPLVE